MAKSQLQLFASRAALLAVAAGALAVPCSASAADIVSRVGGEGSLPFPAQLVDASADGRYVLLHLGAAFRAPEPTGPEASVTSPSGYVIRDQVGQTVIPLDLEASDGSQYVPSSISDDGDRLLVRRDGETPKVYDRSDDQLLALPTVPADVTGAVLSADGQSAAVAVGGPDGSVLYRGPLGGAASKVLDLPRLSQWSFSDDLQTIAYARVVDASWKQSYNTPAQAIGIKQGSGDPHVVAASSEVSRPVGACPAEGEQQRYYARTTDVYLAGLSADGGRAIWAYTATDTAMSGLVIFGYQLRQAGGQLRTFSGPSRAYTPRLEALARTHDLALAPIADSSGPSWRRLFVDGDRTVISSGLPGSGDNSGLTRYTTSDPSPLADEPIAPSAIAFNASEPVDTATYAPRPQTEPCVPPKALDVAPIGEYQRFTKAAPLRSSASMGSLLWHPFVGGARAATKLTVEVKAFGLITVWRTTREAVNNDEPIALPRPLAWIPETVRVTVQPAPGDGGKPATPLVQQYSVYATR